MTITLSKGAHGWQAVFHGDTDMPVGVALPLPFVAAAPSTIVVTDLRTRFPSARFIVKAASR